MIILGLDPGLETVGYGVVRQNKFGIEYMASGVIKTKSKDLMQERLAEIYSDVKEILKTHKPNVVAIEKLFCFKNVSSVIQVAQARGVILLSLAYTPIAEYTPQEIKLQVAGHGRAKKPEMRAAVKRILGIDIKEDNECDGVAIALCLALKGELVCK